jgi:hypothetical protein
VDILIKYVWIPPILSGAILNAQYMISISNIGRANRALLFSSSLEFMDQRCLAIPLFIRILEGVNQDMPYGAWLRILLQSIKKGHIPNDKEKLCFA